MNKYAIQIEVHQYIDGKLDYAFCTPVESQHAADRIIANVEVMPRPFPPVWSQDHGKLTVFGFEAIATYQVIEFFDCSDPAIREAFAATNPTVYA